MRQRDRVEKIIGQAEKDGRTLMSYGILAVLCGTVMGHQLSSDLFQIYILYENPT